MIECIYSEYNNTYFIQSVDDYSDDNDRNHDTTVGCWQYIDYQQNNRTKNDNMNINDINITTESKQGIFAEKLNYLNNNNNNKFEVTNIYEEFLSDNKVDYMSQDDSEFHELDLKKSKTNGAAMNMQREISSTNLLFFFFFI